MKKVVSIFFLLLYAFTTSGASVDMHYCGPQLKNISINIFDAKSECCCMDAVVTSHKGCCSEKSIRPQVSKDRQLLANDYKSFLQVPFQIVMNTWFQHIDLYCENQKPLCYYSNAPPNSWRKIPLYKLLHRFTYYG